ncbi:hypothetical protein JCM10207_000412 [Rhodosporidiobolus poonsookiae]
MPPKSKPKGLKASKRSAPFDPSSAVEDATPAASAAALTGSERTMPLDEDCLTLSDLFELRQSVLDVLYPSPTSLTPDPDPEKVDEARSLLRGILHGCAVLEPFVAQGEYGDVAVRDEAGPRSDAEVEKRRAEAGEDKLAALGLGERARFAEGWILALQAFALWGLAELFEPPEEALKSAAVAGASGTKRRKVDVREPQSRLEWLAAAHDRARLLWLGLVRNSYFEMGFIEEDEVEIHFLEGEYVNVAVAYARELVREGDEDAAQAVGLKDFTSQFCWQGPELFENFSSNKDEPVEYTDMWLSQFRAWAAWVALVEAAPGVVELDRSPEEELTAASRVMGWPLEMWDNDAPGNVELWRFIVKAVVADAKAATFLLAEDAVEQKYRPDTSDAENDEDEGEGEGEVTPLPMDAEEVKAAKKASEEAIAALRETITAFAALPKEFAHPSAKTTQYRKLEEVLLVSSALVNPDDEAGTKAIEAEVERVRKEGGLEEDAEEEGEGEGKGEEGK